MKTPPLPRASDQAAFDVWYDSDRAFYATTQQRMFAVWQAAIAHSAAQAPALYQFRTKPDWDDRRDWSEWENCSEGKFEDYKRTPRLHNWLREVRALFDTPAAPTCTPADERAAWNPRADIEFGRLLDLHRAAQIDHSRPQGETEYGKARKALFEYIEARAAQGAGTAPVVGDTATVRSDFLLACRRALLALLNAADVHEVYKQSYDLFARAVGEYFSRPATHPAPVSTAASKSPEFEGIGDAPVSTAAAPTCKPAQAAPEAPEGAPVGMVLVPVEMTDAMWRAWNGISNELSTEDMEEIYRAMLRTAPEAPATEQQAATAASASIDTPEFRKLMYEWDGVMPPEGRPSWNALVTYIDSRATIRAADGQQGAGTVADTTEAGWLVEIKGMQTPMWLKATGTPVANASDALRFSRKQDAADFLSVFLSAKFGDDAIGVYKRRLGSTCYAVTEHIWQGRVADGQQGASRVVLLPMTPDGEPLAFSIGGTNGVSPLR